MRGQDTGFYTFLKAFGSDALARMTGPLSVPFAVIALWVNGSHPKFLFGSLAVIGAVVASYRVWRKERLMATAQIAARDTYPAELSAEAAVFLREASEDKGGAILTYRAADGFGVSTNYKNLIEFGTPRAAAQARASLEELEQHGYLAKTNDNVYHVTQNGYEEADRLKKALNLR